MRGDQKEYREASEQAMQANSEMSFLNKRREMCILAWQRAQAGNVFERVVLRSAVIHFEVSVADHSCC